MPHYNYTYTHKLLPQCQGCIDIHKGLQWRNVECHHHNGTIIVDESVCYQWNDKPVNRQECYHHLNCIPMWKIFKTKIKQSIKVCFSCLFQFFFVYN